MADKQTLTAFRGQDKQWVFSPSDGSSPASFVAIVFTVRRKLADASPLISLSLGAGVVVNGTQIIVTPTALQLTIPVTDYLFSLDRVDAGKNYPLAYGPVEITYDPRVP